MPTTTSAARRALRGDEHDVERLVPIRTADTTANAEWSRGEHRVTHPFVLVGVLVALVVLLVALVVCRAAALDAHDAREDCGRVLACVLACVLGCVRGVTIARAGMRRRGTRARGEGRWRER